jgi:hypothetical protein
LYVEIVENVKCNKFSRLLDFRNSFALTTHTSQERMDDDHTHSGENINDFQKFPEISGNSKSLGWLYVGQI